MENKEKEEAVKKIWYIMVSDEYKLLDVKGNSDDVTITYKYGSAGRFNLTIAPFAGRKDFLIHETILDRDDNASVSWNIISKLMPALISAKIFE